MLTAAVCPDLRHELSLVVMSRYPLVVIEGLDEDRIVRLVERVAVDLNRPLLEWSSTTGLTRRSGGGLAQTKDPAKALEQILDMRANVLCLFYDLHPYFERPEVVRLLRETESRLADTQTTVLLSGSVVEMPDELQPLTSKVKVALPDRKELRRIVQLTARELETQRQSSVKLVSEDYDRLADALVGLHTQEARRALYQAALGDGELSLDDLAELRAGKQRRLERGSLLQWVEPLPGLSELGGSPHFKRWVDRRSEAYTEAARLFGIEEPKGLLLVGVPGTGKSLACRALAGEWKLPLLRLDPGRLYDKFVGQTEANLRKALETAEAMAPAVVWMDEIEKALASGGGAADDGLSQRVLGTLLTWMQDRPAPVFVMATSNDVTRLPVELLRRGRFDEVFFVDLPGPDERELIFAIHIEKRERDPRRFDLARLAEITDGFSGAEIEGVVVAALYHAFSERQELSDNVLQQEVEKTRPLSVLRPREIAELRQWGATHASPA